MKYLLKVYDKNAKKAFNFEYEKLKDAKEHMNKAKGFGSICELFEIKKIA